MMVPLPDTVDAIIIGPGAFGCALAIELRKQGCSVLIAEREDQPLGRASYNNQARVHQGYHYPRSILTATRSRINFKRFLTDYGDCVEQLHPAYYAIGRKFSKVNAQQFQQFCRRIGAPAKPAPQEVKTLFRQDLIEEIFSVEEPVFNAHKLRDRLVDQLIQHRADLRTSTEVMMLTRNDNGLDALVRGTNGHRREQVVRTRLVFNCTYSGLNDVLRRSNLETYTLKHELTEMALVSLPPSLDNLCVTIMDGPFFSLMPFPTRGLHTLSHVRYTPHFAWWESVGTEGKLELPDTTWPQMVQERESRFRYMQADASRYIPALAKAEQKGSIWEIKSLMPRSEVDDSRPILFAPNKENSSVISVLGGKIDNIYDVCECLHEHLAPNLRNLKGTHEA